MMIQFLKKISYTFIIFIISKSIISQTKNNDIVNDYTVYLNAGLNLSALQINNYLINLGFNFGGGFKYALKNNRAIATELNYFLKGSTLKHKDFSEKTSLHYVIISVGYVLPLFDNKLNMTLSPYFALLGGAKYKLKGSNTKTYKVLDNYKKMDVGFYPKLSYPINQKQSIDLYYQIGLINIDDLDQVNERNSTIGISWSYIIR